MNDTRRKSIDAILARIAELRGAIDEVKATAESIREEIGGVRDEEQEAYDAMPEGFQNGERGEKAMAAVEALEDSLSSLEEIEDSLDNLAFDDVTDALDRAKD